MAIEIDMAGKVAVVTGAASGLGKATAIKLASAGARLWLVDFNAQGLADTARELESTGAQVMTGRADLSDPAQCSGQITAAVDHFGRLDALCNVAGMLVMAESATMATTDWNRTMAVNLTAPFLLCQAAIPHLLETNGAIVNVASVSSFIGEAYATAYCASKAGLLGMTKSLAMEYIRRPIRINAVAPGGMATNIASGMAFPEGADFDLIARYNPLRSMVEVDDVADMICLLASPAGRGFHGNCIGIDAGMTAG